MKAPFDGRHLIVRLPNWLGDTVMALPALRALRAARGEGRITLVGAWAPLLAGQAVADHHVAYPRGAFARLGAVRGLRRLGGDSVLLLPNSLEAAIAAWLWGARWIVGYATDGRGVLLTHPLPPPRHRRHQVQEYLGLLEPFGVTAVDPTPRWIPGPDGEPLDALLPREPGASRIGVHLGAAFGPSKLWPADRLAALCRELARQGRRPVLLGTAGEADVEREILTAVGNGIVSLVGRDTPEMLPGLLARLDALVSVDTGVAHLAAAVGVPVVALFGPTDPALTAPRGAGGSTVIWKPPRCAPCFLPACPIEHPCMRAIELDEVLVAVERRLAAGRR